MRNGTCCWNVLLIALLTLCLGCQKDSSSPQIDPHLSQISSPEFERDLLFVGKSGFQIETTEPATFSSADPRIRISSSGLISRITSAEVVPIDVHWTGTGAVSRIYALGATDDDFDPPYDRFHGRLASDPVAAYRKGWETLSKLPDPDGTYAIILRHGDADQGRDRSDGPDNWWKSCDDALARQLNDTGKVHATRLGAIFKELGYPISRVISSEFCRAKSTAELINAGPAIVTDGRINHPEHNTAGNLFRQMVALVQEQPIDGKMTLVVTHHPINERGNTQLPTFPAISPFSWTGAYIVRIAPDKTLTYEGAVSYGMFDYWSRKKMNRLDQPSP
ncbi:MAG TPA: histidine phosphatase family protein [Sphingobacteriaceae bacterium]